MYKCGVYDYDVWGNDTDGYEVNEETLIWDDVQLVEELFGGEGIAVRNPQKVCPGLVNPAALVGGEEENGNDVDRHIDVVLSERI